MGPCLDTVAIQAVDKDQASVGQLSVSGGWEHGYGTWWRGGEGLLEGRRAFAGMVRVVERLYDQIPLRGHFGY